MASACCRDSWDGAVVWPRRDRHKGMVSACQPAHVHPASPAGPGLGDRPSELDESRALEDTEHGLQGAGRQLRVSGQGGPGGLPGAESPENCRAPALAAPVWHHQGGGGAQSRSSSTSGATGQAVAGQ